MAQAHKGSSFSHKINLFAFGDFFCGKTTLGLQLAKLHDENGKPMRLLVIDCESNGVSYALDELEESGVDMDNIYVVWTQSLAEVTRYIKKIANKEPLHELGPDGEELDSYVLDSDGQPFLPTALFIDGASILRMTCEQSLLNLSRRRAKVRAKNNGLVGEDRAVAIDGAGLEFKDYSTLNYSGQELILDLAASNIHCVVSAREKKETKSEKVNGSIQSVQTGRIIADGFKGAEYNTDTLVRLYRDEDDLDSVKMVVLKDRSKTWAVGQVVENPTLLDMQALIDKRGGVNVILKNNMNQAVETEMKIYQEKAGISDEEIGADSNSAAAVSVDVDEIRKQIKSNHAQLNSVQRKVFSEKLKAEEIPTQLSKIDNPVILNRMLEITNEILEG